MKNIIHKGHIFIVITIILISILAVIFINHFEVLQVSFYPLVKNIEKTRLLKYVDNYEILETEHFIIRYETEHKEYAELTGDIADRYYENICNMYEYHPSTKSNIIIYGNEKDFLENLRFDKSNTPIGVYYCGIINILSPEIWINDYENLSQIYEFNGPVVHEFAHLLIDDITRGNYPMWLTEGLALYTEYKITGFEWNDYNSVDYKITLKDLDKRFDNIDQMVAYRKSFEVVKGISETWGFEKLRNMLNVLGEGSNINQSARAVLKINLYDLKNFD
ncbi:hypothetical protein [Proteiniborus sp.]|uniref:peptidase MA family metallohydrolase n=1 Tax=Proteiniborus sp. TaxID=2079015 RepID=UPI003329F223